MNDVELYARSNQLQMGDTSYFLDEYSPKIKWKKDKIRVLDIGSGDGSATAILKTYIPSDYTLLGCDINEKMVNYANTHHRNERTSFMVLDIEGDLPEEFKGSFDHVFSFYTLHWILNQERAFTNIYEMLSAGGDSFMIFVAYAPITEVYHVLERSNKWRSWFHGKERYTKLPYSEYKEPVNVIRKMMENIGFTDIEVECRERVFTYENMKIARTSLKSILPFKIPEDLCNDFMDDYVEAAKEVELFKIINNGYTQTLEHKYGLYVLHARKPIPNL